MKAKQLAMDSALADLDQYEKERKKRESDAIKVRLNEKYELMDYWKLRDCGYPAGSVVIIGQRLFRDGCDTWHFFRTVLNYYASCTDPHRAIFVEATNEEFPERPPWADTVGHVGEAKDISWYGEHIHWFTGEVIEPIETWWMKRWRELF